MSERSPVHEYIPVSQFEFKLTPGAAAGPADGPSQRQETGKTSGAIKHISKILLILSNYIWLRDHADLNQDLTCSPENFRVSLKLSSTAFSKEINLSESKKDDCYFDYTGAVFEVSEFLELINCQCFQDYVQRVNKFHVTHTGEKKIDLSPGEENDITLEVLDDDDDDNNDTDTIYEDADVSVNSQVMPVTKTTGGKKRLNTATGNSAKKTYSQVKMK